MADWSQLGFTSGRRTYRGNKLVGGVKDSDHLRGEAADFTAPLAVLRKLFPNNPILDEGDHRHVSGLRDVPYHGKRGIAGLVNGIDTTAPKGNAMQPMNRSPVRRNPILEAMSRPINGIDPLAPLSMAPQAPQMPHQQPQPAMPQPQGGQGPLAPQQGKKGSLVGLILGALGDAALGYAGRPGVYAPMMMQQRDNEAEDNRFQQRLAAEVEARRQKALDDAQKPPAEVQTAMYWDGLRRSDPAQFGALMSTMDSVKPNYEQITDGEGYVREVQKNRVQTQEIDGVTYYNVNGKWFAAGGQ
jgi:hypothetical protein